MSKRKTWWCCSADFGEHTPDCENFKAPASQPSEPSQVNPVVPTQVNSASEGLRRRLDGCIDCHTDHPCIDNLISVIQKEISPLRSLVEKWTRLTENGRSLAYATAANGSGR